MAVKNASKKTLDRILDILSKSENKGMTVAQLHAELKIDKSELYRGLRDPQFSRTETTKHKEPALFFIRNSVLAPNVEPEPTPVKPKAAKKDIAPFKPTVALLHEAGARPLPVRWNDIEKEVIATAMLDQLLQNPLGLKGCNILSVYQAALPAINGKVRPRNINSNSSLVSSGIAEKVLEKFSKVLEKFTAPPTVVNEVTEVVSVVEMTPAQALEKLSTSEAIIQLTTLLIGRTAPIIGVIDRLEKAAADFKVTQKVETPIVASEVVKRPKILIVTACHRHRIALLQLKQTVSEFKIADNSDNRRIEIGAGLEKVYIDRADPSLQHLRATIEKAALRLGVKVAKFDDFRALEAQLRMDAEQLRKK